MQKLIFTLLASLTLHLTVYGQSVQYSTVNVGTSSGAGRLNIKSGWGNWLTFENTSNSAYFGFHNSSSQDELQLYSRDQFGTKRFNLIAFDHTGDVWMGPNINDSRPSGYRLFVEDGILTEKVKVAVLNSGEWPDYVFSPGYKLQSLEGVAVYIEENSHLPGVPSAREMVEEGNNLGQTDVILLEKVEELTLYIIELNERIKKLEAK